MEGWSCRHESRGGRSMQHQGRACAKVTPHEGMMGLAGEGGASGQTRPLPGTSCSGAGFSSPHAASSCAFVAATSLLTIDLPERLSPQMVLPRPDRFMRQVQFLTKQSREYNCNALDVVK